MPDLPGMTRIGEPNIWRERLNAILLIINTLQDRLAAERAAEEIESRAMLLHDLLEKLAQFSQDHFRFFEEGFAVEPERIELENPLDDLHVPSVEYVFGTILHQIGNDLTIFQRIQEQRRNVKENEVSLLQEHLEKADKLAYVALHQLHPFLGMLNEQGAWVGDSQIEEPAPHSVLTYFHLAANTRILPYAPVALIGIPLSSLKVNRDFLAIPHELGHYLYWHGNMNSVFEGTDQSLRLNVRKYIAGGPSASSALSFSISEEALGAVPLLAENSWLLPWAEEFFADVVSCLLAGPIAALYFQDMLLQTRSDWMYMDDGTYPAAAIRPYIFSETFAMLFPSGATGEQLQRRWERKLQERGIREVDFYPYVNPYWEEDASHIHLETPRPELRVQAVANVKEIVRTVTRQVVALVGNTTLLNAINRAWQANPWYLALDDLDLSTDADVEKAYQRFDGHIQSLIEHVDTMEVNLNVALPDHSWADLLDALNIMDDIAPGAPFDRLQQELDAIRQWHQGSSAANADGPTVIRPEVWKPILEFAGWTTEGPTDGNLHT